MSRPSEVRRRYENSGKDFARELVTAAAQAHGVETALDLWGGGASARALVEALPGVAVVSCETDQELWPALRLDAAQSGYVAHLGDFRKASGKYNLIFLDLCCQWCGAAREAIVAARKMLTDGGVLAITLLAARESAEIAADRLFLVPKSIERATGMTVKCLYPYQSGSPMWLLVLWEGGMTWWTDTVERHSLVDKIENATGFSIVTESLEREGIWITPTTVRWADDLAAQMERRTATRRLVVRDTQAQGLPERLEDPATIAKVARLFAAAAPA